MSANASGGPAERGGLG